MYILDIHSSPLGKDKQCIQMFLRWVIAIQVSMMARWKILSLVGLKPCLITLMLTQQRTEFALFDAWFILLMGPNAVCLSGGCSVTLDPHRWRSVARPHVDGNGAFPISGLKWPRVWPGYWGNSGGVPCSPGPRGWGVFFQPDLFTLKLLVFLLFWRDSAMQFSSPCPVVDISQELWKMSMCPTLFCSVVAI